MHIVVCTKQVVDPDGVNSFALWGRLEIDESGRGFQTDIPLIMNAYDEQAIEAALRLRDDGAECTITAIAVGSEEATAILRHAVALGCDRSVLVTDPQAALADGFRTASLLAAAIGELEPVDLVLCGRQASDFDQGTVPAVLAELLDSAYVPTAAAMQVDGDRLRVVRATPAGEEVVSASLPATVTVSNEIGIPRYPTGRGRMAARRQPPTVRPAEELLDGEQGHPVELVELLIPDVQGHCEIVEGETPAAQAAALLAKLRDAGVLGG